MNAGTTTVAVVAFMLLAAVTGFVQLDRQANPETAATRLVAEDGARTAFVVGGQQVVLETSRRQIGAIITSGPPGLIAGALDYKDTSLRWARETETSQMGSLARLRKLGASGVMTTAEVTAHGVLRWTPGRLDLPAAIADGSTWTSSGIFSIVDPTNFASISETPYRARSRASVVSPTCLKVVREETRGTQVSTTTETWCEGRGIVAKDVDGASWQEVSQWSRPPLGERPQPLSLSVASGWTATVNSRPLPAPLVLTTNLPPARLGKGLVAAQYTSGDLMWITRDHQAGLLAHPGGSVTSLAAVGDSVVAATTQRRLVSYSSAGLWRWTLQLPDIVVGPLASIGNQLFVADQSGQLHGVDADAGVVAWSWAAGEAITAGPVAAGRLVIGADSSDALFALDPAGSHLWTRNLDSPVQAVATDGNTVAVAAADRLMVFDASGRPLGATRLTEDTSALVIVGGIIVRQAASGLSSYSTLDATPGWTLGGTWGAPLALSDGIAVLGSGRAVLLDTAGHEVSSWTLPQSAGDSLLVAPTVDGFAALGQPFAVTWVGR